MSHGWQLHRPSFWPEPRDPWSWQRALVRLARNVPLNDPWPCWRELLRGRLSRRSVTGLYGLRPSPRPALVLGVGWLRRCAQGGWEVDPAAEIFLNAGREEYQERLAEWLVRRSAWARLALREILAERWRLPRGTAPLLKGRTLRVCEPGGREDLEIPANFLAGKEFDARWLLGELDVERVPDTGSEPRTETVTAPVPVESLSALHGPLYLFQAMGWLTADGMPCLPDAMMAALALETPAAVLRRLTAEEEDENGFVVFSRVSARLHEELGGESAGEAEAWADRVFARAFDRGTVEVENWAPGQPRHGRGFSGDRDRKLVCWTIHDDFDVEVGR